MNEHCRVPDCLFVRAPELETGQIVLAGKLIVRRSKLTVADEAVISAALRQLAQRVFDGEAFCYTVFNLDDFPVSQCDRTGGDDWIRQHYVAKEWHVCTVECGLDAVEEGFFPIS